MKAYFQKTFALSDQGVEDFIKSIIWSTLLNISYMFPAMLAFYFIQQAIVALDQGTGMHTSMAVYGHQRAKKRQRRRKGRRDGAAL